MPQRLSCFSCTCVTTSHGWLALQNIMCEADAGRQRAHVAGQCAEGHAGSVLELLGGQAEQVHAGLLCHRLQVGHRPGSDTRTTAAATFEGPWRHALRECRIQGHPAACNATEPVLFVSGGNDAPRAAGRQAARSVRHRRRRSHRRRPRQRPRSRQSRHLHHRHRPPQRRARVLR